MVKEVKLIKVSVESLKANFHEAIDDYLAFCEDQGVEPEKPFNSIMLT